jgi:hypothetical protein
MTDRSIEEPEDDVAEQQQEALPDDEDSEEFRAEPPLEADEADAAEQSRTVSIDEDEYI